MRLPPESVKGAVAFWSMAGFFCLFVVVPLLGYLDDHGLTRRSGDDRILVLAPEQARERIATLTARKKVAL